MIRRLLTRLHRYVGLSLAGFLILAGLSGSAIAFYDELDAALIPGFYDAVGRGPVLPPVELAKRIEAQLPGAVVTYISLNVPPGRSADVRVAAKDFDQVFADPVTGQVMGTRLWGRVCFAPACVMPFLYRFHYTLSLPGVWGVLLMGLVGIFWTIDCFVAFALTWPRGLPFWKKWRTSWTIKHPASGTRRTFDLHRAGGLWVWGVLVILAFSGAAMNLPDQFARPLVSLFSPLQPSYAELIAERNPKNEPPIGFDAAIESARRSMPGTPVGIFHYGGVYGIGVAPPGSGGKTGLGPDYVYLDDRTGKRLATISPRVGSVGDRFLALQYPLHSGRILGLSGRILVAIAGLMVAMLSVTGVAIWWRKRRRPRERQIPHA